MPHPAVPEDDRALLDLFAGLIETGDATATCACVSAQRAAQAMADTRFGPLDRIAVVRIIPNLGTDTVARDLTSGGARSSRTGDGAMGEVDASSRARCRSGPLPPMPTAAATTAADPATFVLLPAQALRLRRATPSRNSSICD